MQQVQDLCRKAFRLCTYKTWKANFKTGDRVTYVFFGPDLIDPSGILLHPKFRHVHLGYAWRDFSLMYTHNGQYVEPIEYDASIDRVSKIFKRKGWTVLRTEIKGKLNSSSIPWFRQNNCVSLTKSALGIRPWFIWTPRSLYLWLLRQPGTTQI